MEKVRFGVIGPKGIAQRFGYACALAGDACEIVAVASRSGNGEAFARRYGVKRVYGDYEELLSDGDVDAVYIALPHHLHYPVARRAIEKGKAVLCEKPFFIHKQEADDLIALARGREKLLMEAMWTLCVPTVRKAKAWIEEGRIGRIELVTAPSNMFFRPEDFPPQGRHYNPALSGGCLYDVGVYALEFIMGVLDRLPIRTQSMVKRADTGVDGLVLMNMEFPDGIMAQLSSAFLVDTERCATVYGSEGCIKFYSFLGCFRCELYKTYQNIYKPWDILDSYVCPYDPEHIEESLMVHEVRHFCALLREGRIESDWIPNAMLSKTAELFEQILGGD